MLTTDGTKLAIFDRLEIDFSLPKHALDAEFGNEHEPVDDEDSGLGPTRPGFSFRAVRNRFRRSLPVTATAPAVAGGLTYHGTFSTVRMETDEEGRVHFLKETPITRAWAAFQDAVRWVRNGGQAPKEPSHADAVAFFDALKNNLGRLTAEDTMLARGVQYEVLLERARKAGQDALAERLELGLGVLRAEATLLDVGMGHYLDEETVVRFVKLAPKGVRLDYLRNFADHVPTDVFNRKLAADAAKVFDNYAVLHYDPEAKSYAETAAEKQAKEAAKRDPILVGLLDGSRKLYVIGDWVSETCDLTVAQMVDVLAKQDPEALVVKTVPSLPVAGDPNDAYEDA